ncbi:MAG: hypothetical protein Q7T55_25380 [Solirubrobacteraceae bacterium]|nr:hypothetical protein [Solirubrobacteraceae bacterium]
MTPQPASTQKGEPTFLFPTRRGANFRSPSPLPHMRHESIEQLLTAQRGLLAVWQLSDAGHSHKTIECQTRGMRQVHDGMYLSGHAPISDWQTWKAATLTTPVTVLGDWSAASFLGMREGQDRQPTTVIRPGSGGIQLIEPIPDRLGSLKIRRSTTLDRGTFTCEGIRSTTVPRTLVNLMPQMSAERADRMVRDVLRLRLASAIELQAQIRAERGARGLATLRLLVDEYAPLPAGRAKSDAEILALAILRAAGVDEPELNVVVAGGEGDLVFRHWGLIVELDGPRNHLFASFDAKKQDRWESAGWIVRRLPTDDVYDRPGQLLAAATDPGAAERRITPSRRGKF